MKKRKFAMIKHESTPTINFKMKEIHYMILTEINEGIA